MLNYTTTTIVNDGANVFADASKKLFRVKFGPELFNDGKFICFLFFTKTWT